MALQKTGISLEAQGSDAFFAAIKSANEAVAAMGAGALKAAGGVDAFAEAAARAARVADLEGKLGTQRKELGILQKELEQTAAKYGEGSTQAQRKALAVDKLTNSIQSTERALASEQRELVAAANATQEVGQAADKAAPQVKDLGQVAEHAGKGFNALGEVAIGALREIGAGLVEMAAEGVKALGGLVADSVKMAGDFDAGLRTLEAVAGDSMAEAGASLDTFREKALQLGADTRFSADEALTAMTELAKGGVPITEVLGGATEAVLNLAAAGGVELAPASEIVAKNLAIWSREGVTAADVTNLIAQAANASTVGVEELANGMANAQGTAQSLGLEYKDFVTTMAVLAPAFSSSQEAGTSLKNFLVRLQPQTKPARKAMAELGLLTEEGASKFFDAQGAYVGGAKAADLLAQATAGLTDAKRTELLQLVFGNDAMGAANQLLQEGSAGYERVAGAMASAGTAAAQAGKMNEGFNAIMDALGGTIDTVKIRIGTALLPILGTLTNNYLIPAINIVGDLVKAFAAFGTGDTFTGFTTLAGIVKPFSETLANIFAQAATASDPFGTLKQALTDTYPGFATLLDVGTKIRDAFAGIMAKAGEVGTALAAFGKGDSFTGFSTLAGVVRPLSKDLADLLATAATSSTPFETFKKGLDNAIPGLSTIRGLVSTTAKDLAAISEAVNGAKQALDAFSQTKMGDGLLGSIQTLKGEFPPLGLSIGGAIRNIQTAFAAFEATPFGQQFIAGAKQAFLDFANEAPTLGAGIVAALAGGLTGGVGNLAIAAYKGRDAIVQAWNDFAANAPTLGGAAVAGIVTGLMGGVGSIIMAGRTLGQGAEQSWNDFVSNTPSFGAAAVTGIINGLTGGVGGIFKAFTILANEGERAWNELVGSAPGIGRAVVTGIIAGATAGASSLFSAIANLARQAYDAAMAALFASSPSQLFADGPGKSIPTGMAQGVTNATPALTRAVSGAVGAALDAANAALSGGTLVKSGNIASLFSNPGGTSAGKSALGVIASDALSLKNALLLANKSATYLAGGMLKLGDTTGMSAAKLREHEMAVGRATEGLQRHIVAGLKSETIERRQEAQTELLEKQTMHAVDAFLKLNPAIDGAGLAALVTSGQLDQMTAELIKQEQETREAERALAAFDEMLESVDASVLSLTANLNAFSTAAQAIGRIRGMADAEREVAALAGDDNTEDRRDDLRDAITEEEEYQKKRAEILAASDFEEDYYNEAGELVTGRRSKLAALEAEYTQDGMSATERRIAAEQALAAEIMRVTAALALQAQAQADLAAAREEASRIRAMDQALGNEYNALRNQQILELAGLERERIDLAAKAAAGDAGAAAQLAALDRQIALIKEAHTLEIQAYRDRAREQIIAGVAAANGIEVGMVEQTPALLAYVDDLMQQIIAATQGALGIASPSKVFTKMGKQTLWGFAKPFTDGNVIGDVLRGVDSAMGKVIMGAGQSLGQALPAATTIRPAAMGGGGNTSYHYGGATTYQMDARGSNWSRPQLEGIVRGVVDRTARSADGTRRTGGYGRRI